MRRRANGTWRRIAERLGHQRGFTLVEMVWAMAIALFIGAAALGFIVVSTNQQNAVASRTLAARDAETALELWVRDLRQAMAQYVDPSGAVHSLGVTVTTSATTYTVSFSIPTPGSYGNPQIYGTPETVTWSCQGSTSSPGYCTRQAGSGPALSKIVGFESATFSDGSGNQLTSVSNQQIPYLGVKLKLQVTSQLDTTQYGGTPHALRGSNNGSTNPIVVQVGTDLRDMP